ncbi:MAG: hypothetical protein IPH57_13470 [Saprospiraceae bacterium]|nr:hypothetical protein [Saprospiraceae bacterium]
MKKIFFLAIWVFLLNWNWVQSQNLNEMDSTRITYIYNYIINYHISTGCILCVLDETSYDIRNSFISLSKSEFTDFEINRYKRQLEIDSIGRKLNLKNRIDYSKLNSQFKIILDSLDYSKVFKYFNPSEEIKKEYNCRLYLKLSDIYYKSGNYYVFINSYDKINSEIFMSHEIVFEFEICQSNGIIAFRSWTEMLGNSGEDFSKKGPVNKVNKIKNINCYDE